MSTLEQFNNLTGDIELNPSSFGLNMNDINNSNIPNELKTAIYSGNIELTAKYYEVLQGISDQKFSLINTDGNVGGSNLNELGELITKDMSGKDSGLYMNNYRIGFWNGTEWNSYIQNDGQAFFGNDLSGSYMLWDGTDLTVKGNIQAVNGNFTGNITSDAIITGGTFRTSNTGNVVLITDTSNINPLYPAIEFYNGSNILTGGFFPADTLDPLLQGVATYGNLIMNNSSNLIFWGTGSIFTSGGLLKWEIGGGFEYEIMLNDNVVTGAAITPDHTIRVSIGGQLYDIAAQLV